MTSFLRLLPCAAMLLAGCALFEDPPMKPHAPAARPAATRPAPARVVLPDLSAYRLGIGDRVRIDVFGEPDLTIEATVDATGQISYPLLGPLPVQRKTSPELQKTITEGLAAGYLKEPDVRVSVVQYRPFYTIGQVRKPGSYPYVIGLTVEKAIAIAGGLTNLASTRQIYLVREDTSAEARRIKVGLDSPVLPGDTLLVEEGLF
jgi:protein involved in polysaccharide export with SLBB domain